MKNIVKKGFSLIELLVVVAIIGILAGIAIVGYNSYVDSADSSVAEANAKQLVRKIATEKAKPADFGTPITVGTSSTYTAVNFRTAAKNYAVDTVKMPNVSENTTAVGSCTLSSTATNTSDDGKILVFSTGSGANATGVSVCYKVKDKAAETLKAF
jgi:prepilin-type N-terminal cleavage/methylation domain-containing protein